MSRDKALRVSPLAFSVEEEWSPGEIVLPSGGSLPSDVFAFEPSAAVGPVFAFEPPTAREFLSALEFLFLLGVTVHGVTFNRLGAG